MLWLLGKSIRVGYCVKYQAGGTACEGLPSSLCTPTWRYGECVTSNRRCKHARKRSFLFLLFFGDDRRSPACLLFVRFSGDDRSKQCLVVAVVLTTTLFWAVFSLTLEVRKWRRCGYRIHTMISNVLASSSLSPRVVVWRRVVSCAALSLGLGLVLYFWSHVDR